MSVTYIARCSYPTDLEIGVIALKGTQVRFRHQRRLKAARFSETSDHDFENGDQLLLSTRLQARPAWPRTPPSIPTTFYKNGSRNIIELPFSDIVRPAPVNYRPFDSLSNPYPYGCSKLCNHPIDTELRKEYKEILKKAKESWSYDNRTILLPDEELLLREELGRLEDGDLLDQVGLRDELRNLRCLRAGAEGDAGIVSSVAGNLNVGSDDDADDAADDDEDSDNLDGEHLEEDEDRISDELLMKYTKDAEMLGLAHSPDSSKIVPLPQIIPPEQVSSIIEKNGSDNRTQIVLDLRRSNEEGSTENHSKSPNQTRDIQNINLLKTDLKKNNKTEAQLDLPPRPTSPTLSTASKRSTASKVSAAGSKKATKKKGKGKTRSDTPEKGFYDEYLEDTQIGASEIEDTPLNASKSARSTRSDESDEAALMRIGTPLEKRAITSLTQQLLIDKSDEEFDTRRLHEQEEVLVNTVRQTCGKDTSRVEAEIAELDRELAIKVTKGGGGQGDDDEDDFWLHLPRTFSFQSSRFELPLDMSTLSSMSPVEYLARFVAVSSARRMLYGKVFVRNRSLKDGQLTEETTITALQEVMGGNLTQDQQDRIWSFLGITLKANFFVSISYKQFAGIASFVERVFCLEFTGEKSQGRHMLSLTKSEIEVADFDRLFSKIEHVKMKHEAMRSMLIAIKESGDKEDGGRL